MPLLCADRLLLAPNDPLQDLPGLRHDEPQTVEVIEHFEQFRPLECGNRVGQLAAFAKCIDQGVIGRLSCIVSLPEKRYDWLLNPIVNIRKVNYVGSTCLGTYGQIR